MVSVQQPTETNTMIIECPACKTRAKLAASREGAKVRCSECSQVYVARAAGPGRSSPRAEPLRSRTQRSRAALHTWRVEADEAEHDAREDHRKGFPKDRYRSGLLRDRYLRVREAAEATHPIAKENDGLLLGCTPGVWIFLFFVGLYAWGRASMYSGS